MLPFEQQQQMTLEPCLVTYELIYLAMFTTDEIDLFSSTNQ
nr:hypothetical protein Q903MT_gene4974 [Picea sitchensis]